MLRQGRGQRISRSVRHGGRIEEAGVIWQAMVVMRPCVRFLESSILPGSAIWP